MTDLIAYDPKKGTEIKIEVSKEEVEEAEKFSKIVDSLEDILDDYIIVGGYKNIPVYAECVVGNGFELFKLIYEVIIRYCQQSDIPFNGFLRKLFLIGIAKGDINPDREGVFGEEALTEEQKQIYKDLKALFNNKGEN